MSSDDLLPMHSETRIDFKLSWKLYKANFRAFMGAQGIGILCFIGTIGLELLIVSFFTPIDALLSPTTHGMFLWVTFLIAPALVVLFAFQGSLYGLSYDIMSGGDQYAEVRGTVRYFRKYWWRYFLLSFAINLFGIGIPPFFSRPHPRGLEGPMLAAAFIVMQFIGFAWAGALMECFPSLTSRGSLRKAFHENWAFVKGNTGRIFKSYSLYFLLFEVPRIIPSLLLILLFEHVPTPEWRLTLVIITVVSTISYIIVGRPILALISTRIYNSLLMTGRGGDADK